MRKKTVAILFFAGLFWFINTTFAYPVLTKSDHEFLDRTINRFQNISKELKKEKAEHYWKVANDAKVLRNAYLCVYTWDALKWELFTTEEIEKWIEKYNKMSDSKKSETIETLKELQYIAGELERSFQIESEENFQWYASTILPTPLYWLNKDNVDINRIMWWKWTTWLLLDSYNTIDQLAIVLPVGTAVTLIDKVESWDFTYYEARTRDFDAWYGKDTAYFLDSRFVEKQDEKPDELIHELPDKNTIYKNLLSAVDTQYIWWGSYYQWIPEINELYPTPSDVQLSTWEQQYKILQWTDCSWLLWQATNGYTPRNTRWLLTFWQSVPISWNSVSQIIEKVQPLDLIVWAWHVIIILSDEYVIESLWKENYEWGAEIVKLDERLEDIFTRRQPVDEWNESELPEKEKFVIRRWFK